MEALMDKEIKIDPHERIMKRVDFQPYADNGGNILAIRGDDYVVIASDTRLTKGYDIYTRNQSKLFKVNDKVMLGSTGCWCDVLAFSRLLEIRTKMYKYDHNQDLSYSSTAQLVSTMLYNRRFFPYYITNIVAGIDENGKGYVFGYDPVGNYESFDYQSAGSALALIQPFLDNQVGKKNLENLTKQDFKISLDEALKITKDAFTSGAEREITCGDGVHICIITKDGIREEKMPMRKD